MATLKHVGRLLTNQKKCCVVYRVLPGDPNTKTNLRNKVKKILE